MYRFTFGLFIFVLCINRSISAPTSSELLSALLPMPLPLPSSSSETQHETKSTGFTTYDQKQSGKYNIHLNIKDVAIIALDAGQMSNGVGDFGEDYYEDYDLSDFTVKPILALFNITSDKPSTTLPTVPPLIHSEDDNTTSPETPIAPENDEDLMPSNTIKEPILKDQPNKTHSVLILSSPTHSHNLTQSELASAGIVITTSTPAPESLPPKPILPNLSLSSKPLQLASNTSQTSLKPNEIPVQIILEPLRSSQHVNQRTNNVQSRNPIRATPIFRRRIVPPQFKQDHSQHFSSTGNNKSHRNAMRNNCVLDRDGQCKTIDRRFESPTLKGILSLLSLFTPREMEKLDD